MKTVIVALEYNDPYSGSNDKYNGQMLIFANRKALERFANDCNMTIKDCPFAKGGELIGKWVSYEFSTQNLIE
jgi:hypothetical protein